MFSFPMKTPRRDPISVEVTGLDSYYYCEYDDEDSVWAIDDFCNEVSDLETYGRVFSEMTDRLPKEAVDRIRNDEWESDHPFDDRYEPCSFLPDYTEQLKGFDAYCKAMENGTWTDVDPTLVVDPCAHAFLDMTQMGAQSVTPIPEVDVKLAVSDPLSVPGVPTSLNAEIPLGISNPSSLLSLPPAQFSVVSAESVLSAITTSMANAYVAPVFLSPFELSEMPKKSLKLFEQDRAFGVSQINRDKRVEKNPVGEKLRYPLSHLGKPPDSILMLGAGSGNMSRLMGELYPRAKIRELDLDAARLCDRVDLMKICPVSIPSEDRFAKPDRLRGSNGHSVFNCSRDNSCFSCVASTNRFDLVVSDICPGRPYGYGALKWSSYTAPYVLSGLLHAATQLKMGGNAVIKIPQLMSAKLTAVITASRQFFREVVIARSPRSRAGNGEVFLILKDRQLTSEVRLRHLKALCHVLASCRGESPPGGPIFLSPHRPGNHSEDKALQLPFIRQQLEQVRYKALLAVFVFSSPRFKVFGPMIQNKAKSPRYAAQVVPARRYRLEKKYFYLSVDGHCIGVSLTRVWWKEFNKFLATRVATHRPRRLKNRSVMRKPILELATVLNRPALRPVGPGSYLPPLQEVFAQMHREAEEDRRNNQYRYRRPGEK
jgi:23S rRNA U2552 (ribose-2'-O)-methylase RlmE/FtsJ